MDEYGVQETNTISEFTSNHQDFLDSLDGEVDLTDKRLARITRLRLISDPGFPLWDLSYCYGVLKDGSNVRVNLPEYQFPKRGLNRALVEMCKTAGVYGKGLGIFDGDVISTLQ